MDCIFSPENKVSSHRQADCPSGWRPDPRPDVTVTIVSWNTRELLRACLRSLREQQWRSRIEVHVVDNASSDGSPALVKQEFPGVTLVENAQNVGFARANNQSWRLARGRYWLLLNSDAEVCPGAIDQLVEFMDARPRAGLATARLLSPDGTCQYCAQPDPSIARVLFEASRLHKFLPTSVRSRLFLSTYWTYDRPAQVGWTWGTALIARSAAVESVGPLSEEFFMYGEDVEWCLNMRRHGWEVWFCPDAGVVHHGGQSAGRRWERSERNRRIAEGYYRAVERYRGRLYARLLRAADRIAGGLERRRERSRPQRMSRI